MSVCWLYVSIEGIFAAIQNNVLGKKFSSEAFKP